MARQAAGRLFAEKPAGRETGIDRDIFQRKAVGKTLPRFPGAHRGIAEPEFAGHLSLGEVVSQAPVFQDDGEICPQAAGWFQAATLTATATLKKFIQGRCDAGAGIFPKQTHQTAQVPQVLLSRWAASFSFRRPVAA